jgi:hypothetical protein
MIILDDGKYIFPLAQQNGESQPPFRITANYNSKINEYILFQEKKEEIPVSLETIMTFERPKPDGEFIMVQLGTNSDKVVKIGANLPQQIQVILINFLKDNVDIFTTSDEMPGIDPAIACYRLNVDPKMNYVAQQRRRQSPGITKSPLQQRKNGFHDRGSEVQLTSFDLRNTGVIHQKNDK